MPNTPYLVKRRDVWIVKGLFLALAAGYFVSLEWQHRTSQKAERTAIEAKRLAGANRDLLRRIQAEGVARGKLRVEQIARVCESGNETNRALVGYIVAASNPKALKKITYYREHPSELPDPRVVERRARAAFPQRDCSKLKVGPTKGDG